VVNTYGCTDKDSIFITVLERDAFSTVTLLTPNGDGINDYWIVNDLEQYSPCKLTIFNRWGDVLYSSSDYKNNWDGSFQGKVLPEGTYYYVLEISGGKLYKGALNILK
jgi:gliding motility-associated-like protein